MTRGRIVGAYPMEAVACDFVLMGKVVDGAELFARGNHVAGPYCLLLGLVSLPFDLVVDAVFLPWDLIAWPFGVYKTGARRQPQQSKSATVDANEHL